MDATDLDKRFVRRLATMVESRLIWYEHFAPWADGLIMKLDKPPHWLLELCTTRYQPDAARILYDEADSPPFESFDAQELTDEYVACLLLRYRRGELSWASFLEEAGQTLDSANGRRPCEELFALLTELRHHEYSKELERTQSAAVERDYQDAIARIEPVYRRLADLYRRSVAGRKE